LLPCKKKIKVQNSAGKVVALGFWDRRKLVSGMLGQSCHIQFRVMCANIKEVKTTNSTGSVKQEDELSPPPA
jgi:hypothetical protein